MPWPELGRRLAWGGLMKGFRLSDVPMIIKIGFAPAIALVMFALLAGGSIFVQKNEASALSHVVTSDMPAAMRMQDVSRRIAAAHGELYMILTHAAANIDKDKVDGQMQGLLKEFDSITTEVKSIRAAEPADRRAVFDQLIKQLSDTRSAVDVVGGMVGADFQAAAGFVSPFEDSYAQMTVTLGKALDAAKAATNARAKATEDNANAAVTMTVLAGLATLAVVGAISAITVLTTRKSIMQIAKATETLAAGNNSVDLASLARKDELGAVVKGLVVFRDNQLHLEQLRADQEAARNMTEEERRAKEAAAAQQAKDQALVVSNLAGGLERLASGDLTYRIDAEFPGEYAKLRNDFNGAITQLEDTLRVISHATAGIQSGSNEISAASDDLSRRTEQQAAALEETAATMNELSATVQKNAEDARQASGTVRGRRNGEISTAVLSESLG